MNCHCPVVVVTYFPAFPRLLFDFPIPITDSTADHTFLHLVIWSRALLLLLFVVTTLFALLHTVHTTHTFTIVVRHYPVYTFPLLHTTPRCSFTLPAFITSRCVDSTPLCLPLFLLYRCDLHMPISFVLRFLLEVVLHVVVHTIYMPHFTLPIRF